MIFLNSNFRTFVERRIEFPIREGYLLTNASIVVRNERIFAIVCCGDHWMDEGGFYQPYPPGTPFDRKRFSDQICYLVELGLDLSVLTAREIIIDPEDRPTPDPLSITFRGFRGFDSARLFVWKGQLWSVMCAMGTGGNPGSELFLARIEEGTPRFTDIRRIKANGEWTHAEKNWMPEVRGGELRLHYRIGTTSDIHGNLTTAGKQDYAHFNGGSQIIPYPQGSMCIVHGFQQHTDSFRRDYWHHIVYFDRGGMPKSLSRPFHIAHEHEIVTGMAYHPNGRLMISYGRSNADPDMPGQEFPFIATIQTNDLWRML